MIKSPGHSSKFSSGNNLILSPSPQKDEKDSRGGNHGHGHHSKDYKELLNINIIIFRIPT